MADTILNEAVQRYLRDEFVIHTTLSRKRTGGKYTLATTFVWDGSDCLYLSGYPGKRDWVANMASNPQVVIHIHCGDAVWDIYSYATVLRNRDQRMPHLLNFINHWAAKGGVASLLFRLLLAIIRINHFLHFGWWGPFRLVRNILDRMPCVRICFSNAVKRQ